jgi:hypothetical protein
MGLRLARMNDCRGVASLKAEMAFIARLKKKTEKIS